MLLKLTTYTPPYKSHSEIEVIILDIEEAIESVTILETEVRPTAISSAPLPIPVCSIVGEVLGSTIYHHNTLERLFYEAGAQGDAPNGNCVSKCQTWLKRMHTEVEDPISVLGKVIREFMEVDIARYHNQKLGRTKIENVLARYGLSYHQGGIVISAEGALPSKSLRQLLREKDLVEVFREFSRCMDNVETDPPAAITAACSILESLCKEYIEDKGLAMPPKQSIVHLWKIVSNHIGFEPSKVEDDDIRKILSGLTSVVNGIGSLRTHTGSAHGRGKKSYRVQARHARLAVHASHTLVGFVLETWRGGKIRGR